jgi:single-strand DNA-binding protein
MNRFIMTGRLVRDPETKYTQDGKAVTKFTVAEHAPFNKDNTLFLDCVAFGKTAETAGNHLHKGSLIGLEGRIQIRSYETQDGQKRRATEVLIDRFEFLERANNSGQSQAQSDSDDLNLDDLPF